MTTEFNNSQKEFWYSYLNSLDTCTQLPSDNMFHGKELKSNTHHFVLTDNISEDFSQFEKKIGVSFSTVLYASWGILLQKYCHSTDVLFGSTSENMASSDILPIRNPQNSNIKISDYLQNPEHQLLLKKDFEGLTLNEVIELSELDIDNSLFDTAIIFTHHLRGDTKSINEYNKLLQNGLSLILEADISTTLNLKFIFDANLFSETTIKNIANHLLNIINYIELNTDKNYFEIDMLSCDEKNYILNTLNNTRLEFKNAAKTVNEVFEEIAAKTPDKIALICEGNQLTYHQVNQKANQIARKLGTMGVKPGVIVAIMMDRSNEMIVSMLAVMKAGGAYLPIDPSYPPERINYVFENSNIHTILTQSNITFSFDASILLVDDSSLYSSENSENLDKLNTPDDLIYILYTSGSTGNPKGVMAMQKNIVGYINSFIDRVKATSNDVVLQSTSISFDISTEEIYSSLLTGATMVISKNYDVVDKQYLVELINKYNITGVDTFPLLVNEINKLQSIPESLEVIISGGDVIKPEYINNLLGNVKVYNSYGPSETTVCATYHECTLSDKSIPIGTLLGNYNIYILDKNQKLLPVGVPGEIYIHGIGVAKGYYNDIDLTNKSFISNPFVPGETMFRTGDRCKWLQDGSIHFMGRLDGQLKVGGYRTEVEEVEKILLKYKSIEQAVVLVKEKENGIKYLCAYLVSTHLDTHHLKTHLSKYLPEFMVPEYVYLIDKMPLTHNGKIHNRKLSKIPLGQMIKIPRYRMLLNGARSNELL